MRLFLLLGLLFFFEICAFAQTKTVTKNSSTNNLIEPLNGTSTAPLAGTVTIGSGTGSSVTLSALVPGGATTGQALAFNGTNWVPSSAFGSGSVTSVALAFPSVFGTVSGSPITTSGTLTVSAASVSAGYFLGSPAGTSGTIVSRALTTGDMPTAVTTQGNAFNGPNQLMKLDANGYYPSQFYQQNSANDAAVLSALGETGILVGWAYNPSAVSTGTARLILGRMWPSGVKNWVMEMAPSVDSAAGTDALGFIWQGTDRIEHVVGSISTSGTLTMPAFSGSGALLNSLNASNLASGTVPSARGGAGTVNGLLKANGSGAVSQAVAGTDYMSPADVSAGYLSLSGGSVSGAVSISGSSTALTCTSSSTSVPVAAFNGDADTRQFVLTSSTTNVGLGMGTSADSVDCFISRRGNGDMWLLNFATGIIAVGLSNDIYFNQNTGGIVSKSLAIKSGSNALAGTVSLSSGTATITSSAIDANTVIVLSLKTASGTPGTYMPRTSVASGSATVTGLATDNSTYNWIGFKVN